MQIAEFQRWTQDTDRETQWNLITTPQLISHLTEEIGEVAQSVNRIYGYADKKVKREHQANLRLELVEAFWFLAKIANRFGIDLDAEASNFIENADEWQGKYFDNLTSSLRALDRELIKAKNGLTLRMPCVAAILRNTEGCVLLQQRDDEPDVPFAGYWTLPGGKVEEEETPEAAIGRELMEEIEIETPLELWKVYERPAPDSVTVVQHVYVGQIGTPISRLAINEGQALRYCTFEEIENLPIAYGFDTLLKEYLSGNVVIEKMTPEDWQAVRAIYLEGIATRNATFETDAPDWEKWNRDHMQSCRLVARKSGRPFERVIGWAALSPVSGRCVYAGVASLSIYIAEETRGQGVGKTLLQALIEASEQQGIWTIEAGIFPENTPSLALHKSCGFREVGRRERIGQMDGIWRDVIFMERRSQVAGR